MAADHNLIHQFAQSLEQHASEFQVAKLVAQVIDTNLEPARIESRFTDLLTPALSKPVTEPQALLDVFLGQGFGQQKLTHASIQHSSLEWVLTHKQGIPISLAVLLIEAAKRCGLRGHGVNFPGHFLVSINDLLIDPLAMQTVDPTSLLEAKLDAKAARRFMQPASVQMLGLRMLNNLKAQHLHHSRYSDALDVVDYQLALCGADEDLAASLHFERGEYWQQLGAYAVAVDAFLQCQLTTSDTQLSEQAAARAEQLRARQETLH